MTQCDHDFTAPIRKGRAHYVCRLCGADITLALVYLAEAMGLLDEDEKK